MRLAFGLIVGGILVFAFWCADLKELGGISNRLQTKAGYCLAAGAVIWGLGYNFEFLRPLVESLLRAQR